MVVQLGWGCLWPEQDPRTARLQWDKPGENEHIPTGMGTAKSLLWGHHITWCQQLGDVTKHLGWCNGVSGAWERGWGCKWGGRAGLEAVLEAVPAAGGLDQPWVSPQHCSPLSQCAKYNPALGVDISARLHITHRLHATPQPPGTRFWRGWRCPSAFSTQRCQQPAQGAGGVPWGQLCPGSPEHPHTMQSRDTRLPHGDRVPRECLSSPSPQAPRSQKRPSQA